MGIRQSKDSCCDWAAQVWQGLVIKMVSLTQVWSGRDFVSSGNTTAGKLDFRDRTRVLEKLGDSSSEECGSGRGVTSESLRTRGNTSRAQVLTSKGIQMRLRSKDSVTHPVTRLWDPGGDGAKKTGLMQSHWLEVAPSWGRARPPVGVGTPARMTGHSGLGLAPGSSLHLPTWPLNS